MRERPEDHVVLGGCGQLVTVVGPNGAYSFKKPCMMWNCKRGCRKKLIAHYIKKIRHNFMKLRCVQIYFGYRNERGKNLSNFTSKNVIGHYCRINGLDTSAIISDKKFTGSERRDKRNFLINTLPEILNQPWERGQRISFSKGWIEIQEKEEPRFWAMVDGDLSSEFLRLRTDEERRIWLSNRQIVRLFKKGEKFLSEGPTTTGEQNSFPGNSTVKTKIPQSDIQGILMPETMSTIAKEVLITEFPSSWMHYDETTLERLAIMTVDGGMSDEEAIRIIQSAVA
jgi:hypothetical protein